GKWKKLRKKMNINNYDKRIQDLIVKATDVKYHSKSKRKAFCKELLKEAKKLEDDAFLAFAHYHMGDCLYTLPKSQAKAMHHIKKALVYSQKANDNELLARVYNLLGIDSSNRGQIELSLEYHMMARTCAKAESSMEMQAMINFNIGYSFMDMGNDAGALKYFMESYRYCKKCDKDNATAWYCRYIICCVAGAAYIKKGDFKRATKFMKEIESISSIQNPGIENGKEEPLSYIFYMTYEKAAENDEKAMYYYEQLLHCLEENELPADNIPDIITLARNAIKYNQLDRARDLIERIIPMQELANIPHFNQAFCELMIEYYEAVGEEQKACKYVREYYHNSQLKREDRKKAFKFYAEMMEAVEEVRIENLRLAEQARTDALTHLPNRLDMSEVSEKWFDYAYGKGISLGVEILDVDKFKEYNDTYGHQIGDKCLEEIGRVLRSVNCEHIYVSRYGGDEFLIMYLGMTDDEIIKLARDLKKQMSEIRIEAGNEEIVGISISQGIRNSVPINKNRMWDYLYAADNALYELKQHNRGDILLMHKTIMSHKSLKDAVINK
ncbi:MAG: GGDEF domain-containing protein, partial [Lachnospiraceae bacterium]|nr:GGDEF domain-containing protein [Lachnospiraceae bacterium]